MNSKVDLKMGQKILWKEKWENTEDYPSYVPQLCRICGGLCKCDGSFHCHADGREGEPFEPHINCIMPRYRKDSFYCKDNFVYPYYDKLSSLVESIKKELGIKSLRNLEVADILCEFPLISENMLNFLNEFNISQEKCIQDFKKFLLEQNIEDNDDFYSS